MKSCILEPSPVRKEGVGREHGEKPPTGCWLFQGERRVNYGQVVGFQVTYFPHGFPCFSPLTQSFDIYEPERKKSHTMSPKQRGARALPSLAGEERSRRLWEAAYVRGRGGRRGRTREDGS